MKKNFINKIKKNKLNRKYARINHLKNGTLTQWIMPTKVHKNKIKYFLHEENENEEDNFSLEEE